MIDAVIWKQSFILFNVPWFSGSQFLYFDLLRLKILTSQIQIRQIFVTLGPNILTIFRLFRLSVYSYH